MSPIVGLHLRMRSSARPAGRHVEVLPPSELAAWLTGAKASNSSECLAKHGGTKRNQRKRTWRGVSCGSVVKSLPVNAGDSDSTPDLGRFHKPWSS